jgi:hypothetical protein
VAQIASPEGGGAGGPSCAGGVAAPSKQGSSPRRRRRWRRCFPWRCDCTSPACGAGGGAEVWLGLERLLDLGRDEHLLGGGSASALLLGLAFGGDFLDRFRFGGGRYRRLRLGRRLENLDSVTLELAALDLGLIPRLLDFVDDDLLPGLLSTGQVD